MSEGKDGSYGDGQGGGRNSCGAATIKHTRAPVVHCGCLLQYSGLALQQQVAEHAKSKSFEEEGKSCDNLAISSLEDYASGESSSKTVPIVRDFEYIVDCDSDWLLRS